MFTPLFHHSTERDTITFVYCTKLGKHYIASAQNICGFVDFIDMSSSQLVSTKDELKEKCWLANYGHYKFPRFPCLMVRDEKQCECTTKYNYINLLEMGYQSKEELESKT